MSGKCEKHFGFKDAVDHVIWNGNPVDEIPQGLFCSAPVAELHTHGLGLGLELTNFLAHLTQVALELPQHLLHRHQNLIAVTNLEHLSHTVLSEKGGGHLLVKGGEIVALLDVVLDGIQLDAAELLLHFFGVTLRV